MVKPMELRRWISIVTLFLLIGTAVFSMSNIRPWKRAMAYGRLIAWDITSYYSYLPAFFLEGDLSLEFIKGKEEWYHHSFKYWPEYTEDGHAVIKTTMGQAMAYAPFFWIGHLNAKSSDEYDHNGFTLPYERALAWSCTFYLIIGLIFLRRLLLMYFDEWPTAISMIAVFVGTNLYYYSTTDPLMPHAYLFSISCVYLYTALRWRMKGGMWKAFVIGVLGGWLCLTRPTLFLVAIAPFLYRPGTWIEQFHYLRSHWKDLLAMLIFALLVISPQLYYWKMVTGHWVYFAYTGERFYFDRPHVLDFLLSYRKGLFVYTPIMALAVVGFIPLFKSWKALFWMIFPIIGLVVFVNSSWWCWWFGGGFGSRSMVDYYGFMAVPLAALMTWLFQRKKAILTSGLVAIVLLIGLNAFQTHQKRRGLIHWDSMTKGAYWKCFLNMHKDQKLRDLWKEPDYEKAKAGIDEYEFDPF